MANISEYVTEKDVKDLKNWFSYHAPVGDQVQRYENLRRAGHQFAQEIISNCPPSADRTEAIRKVREAVMTANAAIACNEEEADSYPGLVKPDQQPVYDGGNGPDAEVM